MSARLFGEIDAAIFGDEISLNMAMPVRHWRENGAGWESHDRVRCDPETNCTTLRPMPKPKGADDEDA